MKNASAVLPGLLSALVACAPACAQEPGPGTSPTCTAGQPSGLPCAGPHGLHWTRDCFPPNCCPDDYCPHPFPRQCWPPYPPFYQCVPEGDCARPGCGGNGTSRLTWWFLPTPRALCEAIWCHP
jgi:hypothetical protein